MGHDENELSTFSSNKYYEYIQYPFEEKQFRVTQFLEDVLNSEELSKLPDRKLFERIDVDENTILELVKNRGLIVDIFGNLVRSGQYGPRFGDWIINRTGEQIIQNEESTETRTRIIRGLRVSTISVQVGLLTLDVLQNGSIPDGELIMSTGFTVLFWQLVDVIREDPHLRKLVLLSIYKELMDRSFLLKPERRIWQFDDYSKIASLLDPEKEITNEDVLKLITIHGIIHESLNSFSLHVNQLNIGQHIHNNARHRYNMPTTLSPTRTHERREEKLFKLLTDLYFNISNSEGDNVIVGEEEYIMGSRELRWRNFMSRL